MFSINPHVIMSRGTLQPGVLLAIRLWAKGAGEKMVINRVEERETRTREGGNAMMDRREKEGDFARSRIKREGEEGEERGESGREREDKI